MGKRTAAADVKTESIVAEFPTLETTQEQEIGVLATSSAIAPPAAFVHLPLAGPVASGHGARETDNVRREAPGLNAHQQVKRLFPSARGGTHV